MFLMAPVKPTCFEDAGLMSLVSDVKVIIIGLNFY